jgi:phosphonate metabolism protein PhnN/1,5-bisphosphokinase (PRPP-forming)
MTRYALYFSPAPGTAWSNAGAGWLGRDAHTGTDLLQPQVEGFTALQLARLTTDARRYGFHATLKAPFTLAEGMTEVHLAAMATAFASVQQPILIQDLQVQAMGGFLALSPTHGIAAINSLAQHCVEYFDILRGPASAAQLAKRRQANLSARQEMLLARWGYPYTEEEFRFHMTLTDTLTEADASRLHSAARTHFAPAAAVEPLQLNSLTIFREESPGAAFSAWLRFPFCSASIQRRQAAGGRLFYVVGPSGVGKDTLLQWTRTKLAHHHNVIFARRTITRPVHHSEAHEALSEAAFVHAASAGHFAMQWQANGLHYGVRRSIDAELLAGRNVVVNGSREYVPQMQALYPDARVIWIEADTAIVRRRLEARQREAGAVLEQRLARAAQFPVPAESTAITIDNSGPIEQAGERLLTIFLAQ